ncbi:MAG: iron-sulfur cluster assembly accessory protein [Cytophagales bacterium]|nr:iron-sulfur cluster assembly accessory protein [Cytophagales bacterium]
MKEIKAPIIFSDEAREEILSLLAKTKLPDGYLLRVGTAGGGCAGVRYVIGFDELKKGDKIYPLEEFEVLIAAKDFMHLIGKRIDFLENGAENGFVFSDYTEAG